MNRSAYVFHRVDANLYTFVSEGVGSIEKVVEFTYVGAPGVLNLGFGDYSNGRLTDDEVVSNNGDLSKVMATIVKIVEDFSNCFPETKIHFMGSTPERTGLYGRILKTYFAEFNRCFRISGRVAGTMNEVPFDPAQPYIFEAYFVKRKNKSIVYGRHKKERRKKRATKR